MRGNDESKGKKNKKKPKKKQRKEGVTYMYIWWHALQYGTCETLDHWRSTTPLKYVRTAK